MSNEHIDKIIIKKGNFPILNVESSLYDAIFLMNKHKLGTACVVNENDELLGIFTDGDLRRIFLTVQKDIYEYMNKNPTYLSDMKSQSKEKIIKLMKKNKIWDVPVLNSKKLQGIIHLHDILDD